MLVLSRKQGEKIILGKHITLTVVAVERGRVKLAFEAPNQVRILRAELAGRQDERLPAGGPFDPDLKEKPAKWADLEPDLVVNR